MRLAAIKKVFLSRKIRLLFLIVMTSCGYLITHHAQTPQFPAFSDTEYDDIAQDDSGVLDWTEDGTLVSRNDIFRPWSRYINDSTCSRLVNRFAPTNQRLHPLVSFPSSGNTWLRYLLESVTGVFTGSEYGDGTLFAIGMLGELAEWDSGWTLVQKTHGFSVGTDRERSQRLLTLTRLGCRQILLVRHPADAIRSTRHYDSGGQLGRAPDTAFTGPDWDRYVNTTLQLWTDLYMERLHACRPNEMLVVFYEQLVNNTWHQLGRILKYLNRKIDPVRLECLKKYPNGERKRNHRQSQKYTIYSSAQSCMIADHVSRLNGVLEQKQWPQLEHKWSDNIIPCR